jgi:translocation and assembly module TamB
MQGLPRTAFSGEASIAPPPTGAAAGDAAGWQARADIRNAVPGQLDRERLPLDRLLADVRGTADRWRAETLQLQVGTGRLQAQGEFQPRTQVLQARAQLQRLPLARIHGKFADGAAAVLSGTLAARGDLRQGVDFDADIAGGAAPDTTRAAWEIRAVQANGRWSPSRLAVERIHVDALRARIDGSDIDVALPDLASIKARVTATAPGVAFDADAAMLQRSGGGRLSLQLSSAEQLAAWLEGLPVIGEQLPRLRATGLANLQADWQGGWRQWADGFSHPSRYPQLRLNAGIDADALHVEMPAQAEGADPFRIDVQGLHARLQGNLALASLALDGDVRANDTRATLDIRAQLVQAAGNSRTPQWNATVERFAVAATLPKQSDPWRLRVAEGLQLSVQAGDELALRTSAGSATLLPPAGIATGDAPLELAWQPLSLSRTASGATRLQSTGSVRGIQPGWIDALLAPEGEGPLAGNGMGTDLRISGEWAIDLSERLDIRARLQRDSGDAWLVEPAIGSSDASANAAARKGTVAGIRTFDVRLQSENEDVALALNWDTERAGVITANVRTRLAREIGGWRLPEAAPLSGNVKARLQDLGAWGVFAPPGWRVRGELDSNVTLAGTVQSPQLQGGIEARGLNIRSALDGVDLYDGSLRATLEGQRLNIVELTLQGGTGSHAYVRGLSGNRTQPPTARGRMVASGTIDWSGVGRAAQGSGIAMDLRASLQQMQVLVRNDRQLSLSGDLTAGLQQGALRVRGDIKVDRASITLPDASAPTLGDDVHVVRAGDRPAAAADEPEARGELNTARPMDLEIKLDLGRDLALQGQGITTRLQGGLTVRSGEGGGDPFRVVGEVRTDEGRYRAWGQALNVETGVVLFNGPYDNPSLNLLAIRPEIDVRAGVRVTGTLLAPRVQLYSEPELPEAEKLSWVVLGRATATTNAEGSNMQQAALGLLANQVGGSLANGLGFDEIGLAESGVSVGKRLSDELYVTYERGLAGAASTLYLFYDITRRFTVRGQTGEASAVDLIYTITYD